MESSPHFSISYYLRLKWNNTFKGKSVPATIISVQGRSNTGIVGSNPTRSMDVCENLCLHQTALNMEIQTARKNMKN